MTCRSQLAFIVFFSAVTHVMGQITDTLYYNSQWELVSGFTGSVSYYRIAQIDTGNLKFNGDFIDYYENGVLLAEGHYNSSGQKNGFFTRYYKNGIAYSKGEFLHNKMVGIWNYFDPDGSLYEKVDFSPDNFVVQEYYDENGHHLVREGTGTWIRAFEDEKGIFEIYGEFADGKRSGIWLVKSLAGEKLLKEKYEDGKFVQGKQYNGNMAGKYHESKLNYTLYYPASFRQIERFKTSRDYYGEHTYIPGGFKVSKAFGEAGFNEVFTIVETPARYPNGIGAFYQYIVNELKYPEEAQKNGVEGKVFVSFVID